MRVYINGVNLLRSVGDNPADYTDEQISNLEDSACAALNEADSPDTYEPGGLSDAGDPYTWLFRGAYLSVPSSEVPDLPRRWWQAWLESI